MPMSRMDLIGYLQKGLKHAEDELAGFKAAIANHGVDFSILWPKFQQSMATGPQKSAGRRLKLGI
jgi:hypothetical protein